MEISEEARREEEVGRLLQTILEAGDAESVCERNLTAGVESRDESAISENLGINGIIVTFQDSWIQTDGRLGILNCGGAEDVNMDDSVEVVPGDLLEIGDEWGKEGHVHTVKCKGEKRKNSRREENSNGFGFHGGINCEPASFKIERKSRIEFNIGSNLIEGILFGGPRCE